MSQEPAAPRRALPEPERNRKPLLAGIAALAGVAVIGTGIALGTRDDAGPAAQTSPSTGASSTTSASTGPQPSAGNCPATAALAVDPAWSAQVTEAAKTWGASLAEGCTPISVDEKPTADIARSGLGTDAGWIPEDPVAATSAKDASLRSAVAIPVGSSPLVVVNTDDAAKALGAPMNGTTLAQMITRQKTWADHGQAGWGSLKLVVPDPRTSVAGALGFASLSEQGRQAAAATPGQGANGLALAQQRIVAMPELSKVTEQLASNPADANATTPAGPRSGITTASLALRAKGIQAAWLDTRSGITLATLNPSANPTVASFTSWLKTPEGGRALAAQGIDAGSSHPDAQAVEALGLAAQAPTTAPATQQQVVGARTLLATASRRASGLVVLDTSASMAQPLEPGSSMRKIDLVLQMALKSWASWPPGMATGLMTFHATNDASQRPVISTVVPLMRNDSPEWARAAATYQGALKKLQVTGGTPLYQAIEQAHAYNTAHYVAGMPNAIVVVTDGSSQDAAGEPTLPQLLQRLPRAGDPAKPIRMIYVALGPKADIATLQRIADATGQTAVQVSTMAELQSKLAILFAA